MVHQDDKAFQNELNSRIAMITDPDYSDPSLKNLNGTDYLFIGLLIVASVLILIWGWF